MRCVPHNTCGPTLFLLHTRMVWQQEFLSKHLAPDWSEWYSKANLLLWDTDSCAASSLSVVLATWGTRGRLNRSTRSKPYQPAEYKNSIQQRWRLGIQPWALLCGYSVKSCSKNWQKQGASEKVLTVRTLNEMTEAAGGYSFCHCCWWIFRYLLIALSRDCFFLSISSQEPNPSFRSLTVFLTSLANMYSASMTADRALSSSPRFDSTDVLQLMMQMFPDAWLRLPFTRALVISLHSFLSSDTVNFS